MQYRCINLILINLKYFNTFTNSIQATALGFYFLIHKFGTLLKHLADKNKTFDIILNLASYTLI